jgi:hypothetical protein
MKLPIDEQYRISSDANQWILQKSRTRKGVQEWESIAYYTDLDPLVKSLKNRMVRESDATTLADALAAIENVTTTISQALTTQRETLRESTLGRATDED